MKNVNSVIVNRVICNFKRISSTIKTNNSVLFRKFLNCCSIYLGFEGIHYVLFTEPMPKRRFVELDDNIHEVNIA